MSVENSTPRRWRAARYVFNLVSFGVVTFFLVIEIVGVYQGFVGPHEVFYPTRDVFCCDTPREAVSLISPRPLLLIAVGLEPTRYEANAAQGFYDAASEPKTLWIIEDVIHGGGQGTHPEEFEQRVTTFFDAALLKTSE